MVGLEKVRIGSGDAPRRGIECPSYWDGWCRAFFVLHRPAALAQFIHSHLAESQDRLNHRFDRYAPLPRLFRARNTVPNAREQTLQRAGEAVHPFGGDHGLTNFESGIDPLRWLFVAGRRRGTVVPARPFAVAARTPST